MGKARFLSTFLQYSSFIASGDPPGLINLEKESQSFLSFIRLVGCAYFNSHVSAFEHTTPVALFSSIKTSTSTWGHHMKWLAIIRRTVWLRADSDSGSIPSMEALQFHWYRNLWVLGLWHASTDNEIDLPSKYSNQ